MTEAKRSILVGVDGGGSKTDCVVTDVENGKILGRASGGPSNWNSVGRDAAIHTLQGTITGAVAAAGYEKSAIAGICLGMAGVDSQADADGVKEALQGWLQDDEASPDLCLLRSVQVTVHNDSVIALVCGTGGPLLGCVLVVGTGTIALAVGPDGAHVRASGWGPAFLDGGSGYDIGQRALAAVARAVDGRGPPTELVAAACRHCQVDTPQQLLGWAYKEAGWSRIASLAPAVLECAEDGDLVAFKIVTTAADEAVRAVEAVVSKAKLKGHRFKMVLSGGLLSEDSPFLDVVRENLKLAVPSAEVVHPLVEPAHGAALLARARLLGPEADPPAAGGSSAAARGPDTGASASPFREMAQAFGSSHFRLSNRHRPPRRRHAASPDQGKHMNGASEWRGQLHHHRRAASTMDEVMSASKLDGGRGSGGGRFDASPLQNIAHAASNPVHVGARTSAGAESDPPPPRPGGHHRRMGSG